MLHLKKYFLTMLVCTSFIAPEASASLPKGKPFPWHIPLGLLTGIAGGVSLFKLIVACDNYSKYSRISDPLRNSERQEPGSLKYKTNANRAFRVAAYWGAAALAGVAGMYKILKPK